MNAYRDAPVSLVMPCRACAERAKLRPPLALAQSKACPLCGHSMIGAVWVNGSPRTLTGDVWACTGRSWRARWKGCPRVEHVHRRCQGEWRELPASEVSA